jgi:hypothetical protein
MWRGSENLIFPFPIMMIIGTSKYRLASGNTTTVRFARYSVLARDETCIEVPKNARKDYHEGLDAAAKTKWAGLWRTRNRVLWLT